MSPRPLSSLHNLDTTALADAYGAIVVELRGLELRRDALKAALLDRAGDAAEIIGTSTCITISHATRWSLDLEAAREKLGEAWCRRHSKITPIVSLRASQIAVPALPAAA